MSTNESKMQCDGDVSETVLKMCSSWQRTLRHRTLISSCKQTSVCFNSSSKANCHRRIAEIQSELEELKNTVKRGSGSLVSRSPSDYSDHRPSFLTPETNQNGVFSPGSSPYQSPFSRAEESFRPAGLTGRIDIAAEDELFMTYIPFNKGS